MECYGVEACVLPGAPTCHGCTVFRVELALVKGDLKVKMEEVNILRGSQQECADMAGDIQALHLLVDEQRRHMKAMKHVQGKELVVDADVGIFTWLDELSRKQHSQLEEVKGQYEKQVAALHVTHVQHLNVLQLQLQTMTNQYYELLERVQAETAVNTTYAAEVGMLEAAVKEQRRHLAASGGCDPDTGLLPLIRKGFFESSVEMERMVEAATQKLREDSVADARAFDRVRDVLSLQLEQTQAELKEALEQLRKSRDFVAEWKRKYEEMCVENEALLAVNEVRVEEEGLARQLADMVAEKVEWEVVKARLEKTRDAALGSVRHWQKEAGNITNDLVTALASRDAFQLQLYTVSASKQALEDEVEKLKEGSELMKQVVALSDKYRGTQPAVVSVDALEELLLAEEPEGQGDKQASKKSRKKRGKK